MFEQNFTSQSSLPTLPLQLIPLSLPTPSPQGISPAIINNVSSVSPSRVAIPPEVRLNTARLLSQLLANLLDLRSHFQVCHWNVKGMEFSALHPFFKELYEELDPIIDKLGERVAGMGAMTIGTCRDVARDTQLKELEIALYKGGLYINALADCVGFCGGQARAIAQCGCDEVTNNMLQEIAQQLDHILYLLEAHLS